MQFLKVLGRNDIQLEIWERGAGYTLASGSSSSAAAAVAHRLGLVDRDVTVHMPGGELSIRIGDGFRDRHDRSGDPDRRGRHRPGSPRAEPVKGID